MSTPTGPRGPRGGSKLLLLPQLVADFTFGVGRYQISNICLDSLTIAARLLAARPQTPGGSKGTVPPGSWLLWLQAQTRARGGRGSAPSSTLSAADESAACGAHVHVCRALSSVWDCSGRYEDVHDGGRPAPLTKAGGEKRERSSCVCVRVPSVLCVCVRPP